MERHNAIVVVIDRLGAGFLGPYGNTWLDTPHWNRLAAESFLCEFALTDSPRLPVVYRSYWQGQHALSGRRSAPALPELARQAGLHPTLITDDRQLADAREAGGFAERIVLPAAGGETAASVEQTHLAHLFSAVIEWLQQAREPFLLWVHAQGMAGPWDAPLEYRQQFVEEDDPLPPAITVPPAKRLVKPYDPDELLGVTYAYAGQICVLDLCLGALLDALAGSERRAPTLLAVTAPRGYPLGEHGLIGAGDEALYGELLHVPWLLRFSGGAGAAQRTRELVQPPDLFATLHDALDLPPSPTPVWGRSLQPLILGQPQPGRDHSAVGAGEHLGMRTPAWYLYRRPEGRSELFAKPDDRWEVNEVSTRCGPVVEALEAALERFQQVVHAGQPADLPPLAESLLSGLS